MLFLFVPGILSNTVPYLITGMGFCVCCRVFCQHVKHLSCCAQLMKSSDTTSTIKKTLAEGPSLKDFVLFGTEDVSQSSNHASEADSYVPYIKQQDCNGNNRRGNIIFS